MVKVKDSSNHQMILISDQFKDEFKKFKQNLNQFVSNLNLLESILNNPHEYINERCFEFRRIIQLNKEESVANIKQRNDIDVNKDESELDLKLQNKIERLNDECESIIRKITQYEDISVRNAQKNIRKLKDSLDELARIRKYYVMHWIDCLTEPSELVYESEIRNAIQKFNKFKKMEKKIHEHMINSILSCNLMAINQSKKLDRQLESLDYYVYYRHTVSFKQLKSHNFEAVEKAFLKNKKLLGLGVFDLKFYSCDIFDNGKFLISNCMPTTENTIVLIYDPTKNVIEKQTTLKKKSISGIKIGINRILVHCHELDFNEDVNLGQELFLVMNFDLEIVKKKHQSHYSIMSYLREPYIIENAPNNTLKLFDLNFNQTKVIQFQSLSKSAPFYKNHSNRVIGFEYLNDRYILKFSDNQCLTILNKSGHVLNEIEFTELNLFKIDLKFESLIAFDSLKCSLMYFDLNGILQKEFILHDINECLEPFDLDILIDKNSQLVFYDYNESIFYYGNFNFDFS